MNSAFSKLKLGLNGKDKIEKLKRIEDVNDNNKVTIQPSDYAGIFKAKVNKIRKVIRGKKYKGTLSSGILTLKRLDKRKLEKISIENNNYKNITIDLSDVDILYDEAKCFFFFDTPYVSLRAKPKQKEFENWKQMICQHKWYIQYKNIGNIYQKKGLKIPDIEIDDDTSEYTEESSKKMTLSEKTHLIDVNKKGNETNQIKEYINNNEKSLSINTNVPVNIKKFKKLYKDVSKNGKPSEIVEEMMELIKLLMSTVQTMNDRIIKLEMSIPIKDTDSNKDTIKDVSEKIRNDDVVSNEKFKQINKKNELMLSEINDIQQSSSEKIKNNAITTLLIFKDRKRRETLPVTQTPPEALTNTQIFKCFISGGHFPISIYEPISSLQLLCCELQNAKILNDIVNLTDPIERILKVAEFVIGSSNDCLIPGRRKCFSSFPGETFDYISSDGWKFHGEHISKSPMIAASYIEHETWEMFMAFHIYCNMSYNSAELYSDLPIRLNVKNKESFIWKKPKFFVNNIKGLPEYRQPFYSDNIKIQNSTGLTIELSFDKKGEINGRLIDSNRRTLAEIEGNYFSIVKYTIQSKQYTLYIPPHLKAYDTKFYCFNKFTIGVNELFNEEVPYIPRSDSRFRNDIRYLEQGLVEKSYNEKVLLCEKYKNLTEHTPIWFTKVYDEFSGAILYKSNCKYWQSKVKKFNTEDGKKIPTLF